MPQRRRLALLALLAAAGERGLSRDKVLGYLWSESSSENARHALEQLLYSMRKQMAEPLFQGTDPLRLDTRVVHADVVEFARAMAANDPSSAVAVYRGPFLDGFYLAGAPEFERWVEAERTRLEADHGEALRKLAAEAHSLGRQTAEIDLRRRLASGDPLGERAAIDLVRALVEAGDWAGALRQAREYEARVRAELPGAQVTDLMELVRRMGGERPSRPTPVSGSAAEGGDRYAIEREVGRGCGGDGIPGEGSQVQPRGRPEGAQARDCRRLRPASVRARDRAPRPDAPSPRPASLRLGRPFPRRGPRQPLLRHALRRGESLRDRLERDASVSLPDALRIACEVADALAYAHGQHIVHRDIRPENILLSGGHAVVADFGIARVLEVSGGEAVSTTGLVLGHPSYMSPEQARGTMDLDGRSDIYSLGCVLYEMLAGLPPFTGPTRAAVLARAMAEGIPPLRTVCPSVPPAVEQAVVKALAKRPEDRFTGAADFARALGCDLGAPTGRG